MTKPLIKPATLDRLEQVVIVVLWAFMTWRAFHSANPFAPLLVLSESAVALFVLIRRPTEAISINPRDWLLASVATAGPLLINPEDVPLAGFVQLGVGLVLIGNIWQATAKLVLRRSFGIAPANRGVKISGPYRLMRHPMYFGYLLTHIGILVLMPSLWNLAIYAVAWFAQIFRLLAEERLLGEDENYRAYQSQVRYRLVPGLF